MSQSSKTTPDSAPVGSGVVGSDVSHGPAKVLFKHSQIAVPASQGQENGAGVTGAVSPADVLRRPALGPVAQATPAREPQAPETVSVSRAGTIRMKMTGTVGLPPGYSTPRPPVSVNAVIQRPLEAAIQKAPVLQATSKHTSGQQGNHLQAPVNSTSPGSSSLAASGLVPQTTNTPANSLHRLNEPWTAANLQVPPGRRRGRPRKDGSNARSALPSPSDAQRFTVTSSGRSYEYWQSEPSPSTYQSRSRGSAR